MNIAGADPGRYGVKLFCGKGFFEFPSNIGEYRELEFDDVKGKFDIVGEYKGRKFTAGTLAKRDSEFSATLMTESKLYEETLILILIALHKTFDSGEVGLVTGLPISNHRRDKAALKKMLDGSHEITLNDVTKQFLIQSEVSVEGAGFYKFAGQGLVRGLNIGSRTVNAITFRSGDKIGKESDTFDFGLESVKTKDYQAIAREIAAKTGALKWKEDDDIYASGGGAIELHQFLKKFYPNLHVVNRPVFFDAEAFYWTAREIYG